MRRVRKLPILHKQECPADQLSPYDLPGKRSVDDNVIVDGGSSFRVNRPSAVSQAKDV